MTTVRRVAVTLLLLTAVAGCAGPARPGPRSAAPPRPRTTSATPTATGPSIADPDEACRGGVPFSSVSPAYTGPGPHKVIGFQVSDDGSSDESGPAIIDNVAPELPTAWAAQHGDLTHVFAIDPQLPDYRDAQLALCMSPPHSTRRKAGSCTYGDLSAVLVGGVGGGGGVGVVSATYDFTVIEASTGRVVRSFRLAGSDPRTCPIQIEQTPGHPVEIAEAVDTDALAARLRPLVEGPAH